MKEYDFALKFKLSDSTTDPSIYEDRLFEAGCDDALLGVGKKGFLALDFIRVAESAVEAIESAIKNVRASIEDATLFYIAPDVVSISDISSIMKCTRQNVLKLTKNHSDTFPLPINDGNSSLWHLAEILEWYQKRGFTIDNSLLEVSQFAMHFNLEKQMQNINQDRDLRTKIRALV